MIYSKKSKSTYWFFIGILYILIWETIFCISQDIETEKQIYRDISKSLFQNLQDTIDNVKQLRQQLQQHIDDSSSNSGDDDDNIIKINKPTIISNVEDDINKIKELLKNKTDTIIKDIINDLPPVELSFSFSNSSMKMPMNVTADSFNVTDVSINSPNIEFPLTFTAENMTYNISIEAEALPISMILNSNKSDVPISLGIYGADNIPVSLTVGTLQAPILNYVFYAVCALVNTMLIIWVIVQQVQICKLTKRLDRIDVSNKVLNGKRYKKGNIWYKSINGDTNDLDNSNIESSDSSISDQVIDIGSSNNNNNNVNNPHIVICKQCGQTNGKTKFCFNCGSSIIY